MIVPFWSGGLHYFLGMLHAETLLVGIEFDTLSQNLNITRGVKRYVDEVD